MQGARIVHAERPIVPSPSGLPTQHLVCGETGSSQIFVGQQWLQPGDRVFRHDHPIEEALIFLSGSGEATIGDETVSIGAGVSLFIPPGVLHGFHNTGDDVLHLLVVFPGNGFATTDFVEPRNSEAMVRDND